MAKTVRADGRTVERDPLLHGKGSRQGAAVAKHKFLQLRRRDNLTVRDALHRIGYSRSAYEEWRRKDRQFKEDCDRIAGIRHREGTREVPDFPVFCERYLGWRLFRHQLQWFDVLEGRVPRDLHPAQTFIRGLDTRLIVNTPPEHAKTSTITVAYTTWSILRNPNELIILVSKNQTMAMDYLSQVKDFLSNPTFDELQYDFGPEAGFESACTEWRTDRIRFGADCGRSDSLKDPTVQALGLRGQIYGKRATKVIIDDAIDTENAADVDKQFNWITRMVGTRVGHYGKVLVIGSRVAPVDLYKELVNPDRYDSSDPLWTVMRQPAVEEFAEDPKDWVTLWPASNAAQVGDVFSEPDVDGLVPMWDGPRLASKRATLGSHTWIQGYQQEDLQEVAIFPEKLVTASINRGRFAGPMPGLHVLAGLDPASSGHTAAVVLGVNMESGKRHVLDVHNEANMTPHMVRQLMIGWTRRFGIREWRVEKVLLSSWLTQDRDIVRDLANVGCVISEHQTTGKCVPTDVEIMTRRGWKLHGDLIPGEDVMTHEGWQPLLDVSVFDAPEKMYSIDTQNLSCRFTEKHRHYVQWMGNRKVRQDRVVTTDELRDNTHVRLTVPPQHGRGVGGRLLAALLGWYVTEGQLKGRCGNALNISQSPTANPEKWAEIKGHLDALGWSYSIYRQETADRFHVHVADAHKLLDLAPGKDKRLGVDVVAAMTVSEREAFMDACLKGDGDSRSTFISSDEHLLDAFEYACVLNGYAARRSLLPPVNGRFRQNKPIWKVRRKIKRFFVPRGGNVVPVPGEGQVWCPTTPSGSWVAKSNGRTFLTGNSKWDPLAGVMSMASLFMGADEGRGLIELPSTRSEGVRALQQQLITFYPETKGKTDCLMAMWFAELRARELIKNAQGVTHVHTWFDSEMDLAVQGVASAEAVEEEFQRIMSWWG